MRSIYLKSHLFKEKPRPQILWAQIFFYLFVLALVGAYIFFSPGWGFMDDWQCHQQSIGIWQGKVNLPALLIQEMEEFGRFRPLFYIWIVLFYWVPYPLVIYLVILILGMGALLLWGHLIDQWFPLRLPSGFNRFAYPLAFFIFLPFWNLFMYISVLEKFVFIFSAISLFFMWRGYKEESYQDVFLALVWAMVGMLGKEVGLTTLLAYTAFAFLDFLFFQSRKKVSAVVFVFGVVLTACYMIFIKSILGGYTAQYKTSLDLVILGERFLKVPGMIKAVFGLAVATLAAGFISWGIFKKRDFHPLFFICPLWVIFYVILILPWGFPTYLLAPLAPFIMLCIYFWLVVFFKNRIYFGLLQFGTVVVILLVAWGIIIPRISKMADKRKVVEAIMMLNQERPGKFYYPPPFMETVASLQSFSSIGIVYGAEINGRELAAEQMNYLILNDEAGSVQLAGVFLEKKVYHNNTWEIWSLGVRPGQWQEYRLQLPKNMMEKIKSRLTGR